MNLKCLSQFSLIGAISALGAPLAWSDVVITNDGSQLNGEIVSVKDGKITLVTQFAGKIEIDLATVKTFSSDESESVRLADGNVFVGPVRAQGDGTIEISTSGGAVSAQTADVVALWSPGDQDPDALSREESIKSQIRTWSYEASASITGRSGNTDQSNVAISAAAKLEGPNDRFDVYGGVRYGRENSVDSAEEGVFGMAYTNFFTSKYGWYVREEVEYDRFQNIEFRSTTAAGLSYRFFKEPLHSLEGRAGIAYRYEGYYTPTASGDTSNGFPGLDFGLAHYWKFADWGEMNNNLRYTPSVDDFGDYLVFQSSTVDLPLGASDFWKLRLSLSNQYNSSPTNNREKLDTTYGLSLLLKWE